MPAGSALNRRNLWNFQVTQAFENPSINPSNVQPDAYTLHSYETPGVNDYNNLSSWVATAPSLEYRRITSTIQGIQNYSAVNEFWMTEYNIIDNNTPTIAGTWAHGLYNLCLQLKMMNDSRITMTIVHSSNAGRDFGMMFNTTYAFGAGTTDRFDLTATGMLMKVFGTAYASCTSFRGMDINSEIYGQAFFGAGGNKFLFVNVSNTVQHLDLETVLTGEVVDSVESYVADLTLLVNKKDPTGTKSLPTYTTASSIPNPSYFQIDPYQVVLITCLP
jgi:hypothetical protein